MIINITSEVNQETNHTRDGLYSNSTVQPNRDYKKKLYEIKHKHISYKLNLLDELACVSATDF